MQLKIPPEPHFEGLHSLPLHTHVTLLTVRQNLSPEKTNFVIFLGREEALQGLFVLSSRLIE